jgi:8-oxo-dGTP pyrophosphatase MutT (NUDIX family)
VPHIHAAYDYVVTAIIVYEGKVLLVNHPRYDKWIPMGGHIELNEDPEQALYREVQEETGLEVELLSQRPGVEAPGVKYIPTPDYVDVHEANPPHKHIGFNYFVRAKNDQAVRSAEHTDMRWFSQAELADPQYNLSPSVQFLAVQAIQKARQ